MSQELIAIIEQLEREKGIKKEVLIAAVESAILSAARKVVEVKPGEELSIKIDPKNGDIQAFKNEEIITNIDFGRIAASTARQVVIQKIREAEKEVIYTEFQARVGELASGTVYRFEKGNIIVDLLGKAEGVLLKREQSSKEEFKQGQRIRAYILEVRKEAKGPQIILSRAHPNLVKRLFELEVPEIYDGTVEMKAISRQAGERTKIAVWSKNEKVDSVGACVGMRGNRVKNIVNELQGEKIDIVRYNDDIKEYIKAALLPAEISEIKLNKENKRAEVIVADDQLSLAIGKHGQNVRLASKLIDWELDIRTKATATVEKPVAEKVEAQPEEKPEEAKVEVETKVKAKVKGKIKIKIEAKAKVKTVKAKKQEKTEDDSLSFLSGVGEKTILSLKKAGFNTAADIAKADIKDIIKIKGIGEKKAEKMIEQAKKKV